MSAREQRHSPYVNIDAVQFIAWLDSLRTYEPDVSGVDHVFINGVHLDPAMKRTLRRYRNRHVQSVRTITASKLLKQLNLKLEDMPNGK